MKLTLLVKCFTTIVFQNCALVLKQYCRINQLGAQTVQILQPQKICVAQIIMSFSFSMIVDFLLICFYFVVNVNVVQCQCCVVQVQTRSKPFGSKWLHKCLRYLIKAKPVLVFQLDRLPSVLTAKQIVTAAQWNSNKTTLFTHHQKNCIKFS